MKKKVLSRPSARPPREKVLGSLTERYPSLAEPFPLADKQMQIRMPLMLYEKLRVRAFEERRSLGAIARLLIEDGLKRRVEA